MLYSVVINQTEADSAVNECCLREEFEDFMEAVEFENDAFNKMNKYYKKKYHNEIQCISNEQCYMLVSHISNEKNAAVYKYRIYGCLLDYYKAGEKVLMPSVLPAYLKSK